ncbi:hypothetical protein LguiA_002186 [Lonicera macranthoides]
MAGPRVLVVTFPGQGHINPSLQFAKRLIKMGVEVTFSTSQSAINRISKSKTDTTIPQGLTLSPFFDGYENGLQPGVDVERYISEVKNHGSQHIAELITTGATEGKPFAQVVYTTLISWAGRVAHCLCVPCTLLWIQPATIFDIYYYYFNGYGDVISKSNNDPSSSIQLPGLPLLTSHDLPSFLLSSNTYNFALPAFKEHFNIIEEETNPNILVNTFDDLEFGFLRTTQKLKMKAIGPLMPSAFLDGKDPSDKSFGGDLFQKSRNYIEWLDSKTESSVVYISFGSISVLSSKQIEEIGQALLQSSRPFLWVIREDNNGAKKQEGEMNFSDELKELGMIVPWCSQVEVLSHKSVGCFVTHCGWNSTLESVTCGIPMVAFPQWTDQATNAKLIQDVWKTGVRVKPNEEGIVERSEMKECIEMVMGDGERGHEVRKNAKKWKDLAKEAVEEGGSSHLNLKAFVDEI